MEEQIGMLEWGIAVEEGGEWKQVVRSRLRLGAGKWNGQFRIGSGRMWKEAAMSSGEQWKGWRNDMSKIE